MAEPHAAAVPKPCCVCDAPGGKHCTKCKSRHYCSKACQLVDWNEGGHKAQCKQLAAELRDRLLDELMSMPAKMKIKEEPIVTDVTPAYGFKAAARLSAVRTTALAKAAAPNDDVPGWRGMCAICLDRLPVDNRAQVFYACCCKAICKECNVKCDEYDTRCPLCRAPRPASAVEVLRRLQKHVDKGNAEAQLVLGNAYLNGGEGLQQKNSKRAFQLYELSAAQGHAPAQDELGQSYSRGNGVKIDNKTAAQWFRRSAEQGYHRAQYNLALMLYKGTGVAQSYGEAVKWWRLAAAQGETDALFNLGLCYTSGHGVSQDLEEGLRCFRRAAAKGHAQAAAAVGPLAALAAEHTPTLQR